MSEISIEDKISCIKRELVLRLTVYGRKVEAGKMRPDVAAREIAVMKAILEDYRDQQERESMNEPSD
jgi:hypothetical protein